PRATPTSRCSVPTCAWRISFASSDASGTTVRAGRVKRSNMAWETTAMPFVVAAEAYDRFMGRYSRHLAPQLADFAGVTAGARVLDVGSGPGALSAELVARGAQVTAVDPS